MISKISSLVNRLFSSSEDGEEPSDEVKREKLYECAKAGYHYDQYAYAYFCLYGYGGAVNFGHAEYWLNVAASNGEVDAQFLLGECYLKGDLLQKDIEKAKYWLIVAATNEHEQAENYVENNFFLGDPFKPLNRIN